MKKLYALCLLLTMMIVTGFKASALSVKIEWDTPGSVMLKLDGTSNPFVELGADQTSYEYTTSDTYGYVYVYAADSYALIDGVTSDGTKINPTAYGTPSINVYVSGGNNMDGKTVKINCVKIERNDTFDIDIVNGLEYLSASFASKHELDLKAGNNSYSFNPQIDGRLTLSLVGIAKAYSVTLDGTPIDKYPYGAYYYVDVTPGSKLEVRVFESEADIPVPCDLMIKYGADMEGCLYNIYNRTTGKFYEPKDIVDNTVTLTGGNEVKLNLVYGDYTYSKFTLDGEDITDKFKSSLNNEYIEFIVPNTATATLEIEGTAKVYGTIDFTGYISGIEGVEFSLTYGGAAIDIPEGEALTESVTIGDYTLTPANAQKFTLPISEKDGKVFFRPKNGYFIADLYTVYASALEQHSGSASIVAGSDGTTFYMVVKKLDAPYTFNLTTTGSSYNSRLTSVNQAITDSWNNPEGLSMTVAAGTKTVSFVPGYDNPMIVSVFGEESMSPAAYLDGAALTAVTNSDSGAKEFTFDPYVPVEGDGIAAGTKSDVQVYLTTDRPTMSGASLELKDGAKAEFYYSPVRHEADPTGQSVISGTTMIVKPASKDMVVTYKDEQVELDANGEFVFEAKGNARNNVVTVTAAAAKYADMLVSPADGATVKTLTTIKITLPCIDPTFETMLDFNEDVLPQLAVKKGDQVVATFGEIGDVTGNDDGTNIVPIILSEPVTAAGEYTIYVPAKAFVEKAWSDADNAMMPVEGGYVTPEYNGTVTVDPAMLAACEKVTFDPESGSTVEEIEIVRLTFTEISAQEYFNVWEFPNATFTNGETTVEAAISYDNESTGANRAVTVTPMNEDEEFAPITAAGTWTMTIPAGAFVYNGESNDVITAEYTIASGVKYADMLVSPEAGATVKTLSTIKVTLPVIDPNFESMLDYNEEVLPQIAVKKGDEVVATFGELGDPNADDEGNTIVPIILSEAITAAGTYTIEIPEKAFVQKAWSDADEAMMPVEGGFVTAAYSGDVTVDPDMISVCDDYTLDPESGSTVEEISVVKVTFNAISAEEYFSGWEFQNATFTNGETTVEAIVNYDWMSESENRVMTVRPIDGEEEFAPITAAGTWTMTIAAGTFSYDGETNAEITAEYTIGATTSPYIITPESGSVVDNLAEITIEFPGVSEIEYNDLAITMTGTEYNASSTDVLGTGNTRTVNFRNPTVDGEYTVTFPAGVFTLDGVASEEATATYTFQSAYVLTPASGSTLETFEVAIAFPHATEVELVGDATSILLTNGYTYASPSINCVKDADAAVPTFLLSLPESAQQPPVGYYNLIIEEGVFQIDGKPSVSIFANYTIEHEVSAEYIVTPGDGVIVYQEWGYDFAFIFDETATLTRPDASKIEIALDGVSIPATSYETGVEMNMLMFMVTDSEYCKDGVLTVNIAAGAFKIGSADCPAIEAEWKLTAPKTFEATVTPGENDETHKLTDIETIYINFPEAASGEVFNEYGASLRSSDYSYFATGAIEKVDAAEVKAEGAATGVTFAVTFEKTTTAGVYLLSVREGTFVLDGVHNSPELSATYYVDPEFSGIDGILADENGNVTVYTVDGRLVLEDAPAAELRDLKKGLYIINGVKVVLK